MIVSLIAGVIGLVVGGASGFWRSLLIAAAASAALFAMPGGIWIAEFPVGVIVGGLLAAFSK